MKTFSILSGLKSRYFMLVVCVTLLLGAGACSSEEFGTETLEVEKELALEERIEQILSQYPQTRANEPFPVVMKTKAKNVHIKCFAKEEVTIYWDDMDTTHIPRYTFDDYFYTFPDGETERVIFIEASKQSIQKLDVSDNGLLFLNVQNNTNLEVLSCSRNSLIDLRLEGCPSLQVIKATYNKLSTIDVDHLELLDTLYLSVNNLTTIDVSKSSNIHALTIDSNPIKDIDLSKNTQLQILFAGDTRITNLDLTNNTQLKVLSLFYLFTLYKVNNETIDSINFSTFTELQILDMRNTTLKALNLSNDSLVYLNVSGTLIKYLDISETQIKYLDVSSSNLRNFKYTEESLLRAYYLSIAGTPFEKNGANLEYLITDALPNRTGKEPMGSLITKADITAYCKLYLKSKNWEVSN